MKLFGKGPGPQNKPSGPKKIFAADIEKVAGREFGEVKIAGEKMKNEQVKQHLKRMVKGGKTVTQLEKNLKEAGVRDGQISKRKRIMGAVSGPQETPKKRIRINRALDDGFDPLNDRARKTNPVAGQPMNSASQWQSRNARVSASGNDFKTASSNLNPLGGATPPTPPPSAPPSKPTIPLSN